MKSIALFRILKDLGGLSVVLYALGFLVVRARLRALGVWSGTPPLDATYLSEGALLVQITLWTLLRPFAGTFVVVAALAWLLWRRWQPGEADWAVRARRWTAPSQVVALSLSSVLGGQRAARALGHHRGLLLPGAPPMIDLLTFPEAVFWTLLCLALWKWMSSRRNLPSLFRVCAGLQALTWLGVILPVVFALSQQSGALPQARIKLVDTERPVEGLLIWQSGEEFVFYECSTQRIRTEQRPRVLSVEIRAWTPGPQPTRDPPFDGCRETGGRLRAEAEGDGSPR